MNKQQYEDELEKIRRNTLMQKIAAGLLLAILVIGTISLLFYAGCQLNSL